MKALSLLWLVDLQPQVRFQHGASLRWFSLSRELLARGHRVCFSVDAADATRGAASAAFLDELRAEGWLSARAHTDYRLSPARRKLASLLGHPGLAEAALRGAQDAVQAEVEGVIAEHQVDVVVLSDRRLLFLVPRLGTRLPVVVDWIDSPTLYAWRALRAAWQAGALGVLPGALKRVAQAALQERHYGRRASLNLVAAPADLLALNRLSGRPERGRVVLNGLSGVPAAPRPAKVPAQLVFTGTLSYPPNQEAALWFLDRVLPRVRRVRPEVTLVVAGRDPQPALLRRQGEGVRIAGGVFDLRALIAESALYVAPLVSGGGFRNKVLEAVASGTFLAGTSLALEFLPERFRRELLVGDTPEALASRVLEFLQEPARYEARLPGLQALLADEYTWARRADELEQALAGARAA